MTGRLGIAGAVILLTLVGALVQRWSLITIVLAFAFLLVGLLPNWMQRHQGPERSTVAADRRLQRIIALLPLAIGVSAVNYTLGIVLLAAIILVLLFHVDLTRVDLSGTHRILVVGFVAYAMLIYRAEVPLLSMAAVATILLILAVWRSSLSRQATFEAVMYAVALYLVASVVAYYLFGLRSGGATSRLQGLESTFNLLGGRIFFPFSNSLVVPPVLASAYACWGLPQILSGRDRSPIVCLGLVMAVFVMVAANYRVPLVATIAVVTIGLLRPALLRRLALPVSLVVLLLPFWWNDGHNPAGLVVAGIERQASGAFQRSTAAHSRDTATLNNRSFVWHEIRQANGRSPLVARVFGFGPRGQVKAGAGEELSRIFHDFLAPGAVVSSHSTAWQTLLDGGVVGAALLTGVVLVGFKGARTWQGRDGRPAPVMATPQPVLLALLLSAGTEVTLAPGMGSETFWVFVLLVAASILPRPLAEPAPKTTTRGMVA